MPTPDAGRIPLSEATTSLGRLVAQLTQLVLDESEAIRTQAQQIWSLPLAERVARGRAIAEVRIDGIEQGLLRLTCPQNDSRFREGDVLVLHRGNPFYEPNPLVTVELDDECILLVSSEDASPSFSSLLAEPADGWVLDEGFLDLSDMAIAALNEAADSAIGRSQVLPILNGDLSPLQDPSRYERGYDQAIAWELNESQADALATAYSAHPYTLIQGPPGTGKTRLLARLAQLLASEGERVFVSAFTHRAINNALNAIAAAVHHAGPPVTALKIGRAVRNDDLRVAQAESFDTSPLVDLSGGYVVGATPFAARTQRLQGVEFDTLIFDEASQITLPLAIMAMLRAKRYIFIGDQQQLPPVLATRRGDQILRDSVFGVLAEHGARSPTMLTITYRMNAELAAWPGTTFYYDELVPAEQNHARRISYRTQPRHMKEILDPEAPCVFVGLDHINATTSSMQEAGIVAELIDALLDAGVPAAEIGVVVPYRAQARTIRKLLHHTEPDPFIRRCIVVDTVERMQGQEREITILSLTTSNLQFASHMADFLFQPQRLNVAITRARSKLIIIGSRRLLDTAPTDQQQQEWVELLRDLIAQCAHRPVLRRPGSRREWNEV
ncbi:MAG TPA: AAA domain-containing protein [Roseiflexaceae bacterium]|nr:AAA domain-containing protein [Roseiflexaceae bacterium]